MSDKEYEIQPDLNTSTFERPTGRLRWNRGVLQQEWHIECREARRQSLRFEYRDVPTNDD